MKKLSLILFLLFFYVTSLSNNADAAYDPLSVPNNKVGIHILFPSEIFNAKDLVNSSGGDWGYVTIPIQAGDRDLEKWQKFMDDAKKYHLIPLIRIATDADYFNKSSWRKPEYSDVVDFANFLNSLDWPVKNKYIIVFNEVNRADEWEGQSDPFEYAKILSFAVTLFKSKDSDFFIISAGMDNAAASDGKNYSSYDYFKLMNQSVPGIFNQIDGFSSHSYPNPAFSSLPTDDTTRSVNSFFYEFNTIKSMMVKQIPIFITETGWDTDLVSDKVAAGYLKTAFLGFWNDSKIVAITPFLLSASGPFEKFSFLKVNGEKREIYKSIESIAKVKGSPIINPDKKILGEENTDDLPVVSFTYENSNRKENLFKSIIKKIFLGI